MQKAKKQFRRYFFKPDFLEFDFDITGDHAEDLQSIQFLQEKNVALDRIMGAVFDELNNDFGKWALTRSALRYLVYHMLHLSSRDNFKIVELGGGKSTLFWDRLSAFCKDFAFYVTTIEHDPVFTVSLKEKITSPNISVQQFDLVTVSDDDWDRIFFSDSLQILAENLRNSEKNTVVGKDVNRTRIHNSFYDLIGKNNLPDADGLIDVLVVDGPHGNGRSLAFAYFAKNFKPGTLILIDDVSHYPFLEHLSKFAVFKILKSSFSLNKQWILVEIQGVFMPSDQI